MARSDGNPKHTARVGDVFFLPPIGLTLRWATRGILREDLPPDIRKLLARLDELEEQQQAARQGDDEARGDARDDR